MESVDGIPFGMEIMQKIGMGDFDEVYLTEWNGEPAVLKQFNPHDSGRKERYSREKHLYHFLEEYQLSPQLFEADDYTCRLIMEYIPDIGLRSIDTEFERVSANMKAASKLHGLPHNNFPPFFRESSLLQSSGRAAALQEALTLAELSPEEREQYGPCLEALTNHVGNPHFDAPEKSLLHGDFHPFNILYGSDGLPRFIDFGRSRFGDCAFDVASFSYRITNGYYLPFSDEEICRWRQLAVSTYPTDDRHLAERVDMYYYFLLGYDLPWLMRGWPTLNPGIRGSARKVATMNLRKIKKGFQDGILGGG